ncbi:MAG: class I SAM-dependent methyltransferase [Alphaproteobacteria bacterium]|nr:class I SAM-dependent methyltransferase [Alphaproteobacteria bacterium]
MTPFYEDDLAHIHHVGFSDMVQGAAPGLLDVLREAGITDGLVVDLGCGAGLWLRDLIAAGYQALGVDLSPQFITLAREAAPAAELRVGSAHEVDLPDCAAVTAISEVLAYVPPEGRNVPEINALFARVHRALDAGGLFLFDLIVAEPGERMAYRTWRTGPDWAILVDVDEDTDRKLLTRRMVTFREMDDGYRRGEETHWQRVYDTAEIEAALREIGFAVRSDRRYGEYELAPRRRAFIAQKPLA